MQLHICDHMATHECAQFGRTTATAILFSIYIYMNSRGYPERIWTCWRCARLFVFNVCAWWLLCGSKMCAVSIYCIVVCWKVFANTKKGMVCPNELDPHRSNVMWPTCDWRTIYNLSARFALRTTQSFCFIAQQFNRTWASRLMHVERPS